LECRSEDVEIRNILAAISDSPTWQCALAERALLRTLRAGCHAPVGVDCHWNDAGELHISGVVLDPLGTSMVQASRTILPPADLKTDPADLSWQQPFESLGQSIAEELLAAGATALIEG
ncbi:MAG: hypothetical protein KDA78_21340, partial [Planctomycetaceae bacterium]|nr:hypothetical protein [Planctomycetaceae bacterium]